MTATTDTCEEIELIVEAGDASDALDLARTLTRQGSTELAIQIRRTVTGHKLDRDALRAVGANLARERAERAALFTPAMIDGLYAMEGALRESARQQAAKSPAARRAESAASWTARQRYEERVAAYNAEVDRVNRARGLAASKKQAAAVASKTCGGCFQERAANGSCGC
ncbi:hypothetical protein ACIOHS_27085 [Streptomyces sp. NPDC088253]|uniref:hypothetical protein n=1 Tax=Streptomyces sp. NPDC088253 TaxID=3365846 RepID=UPI003824EA24